MNLDNFFNPKTVAVIGASGDQHKVGYALMKNLADGNKERKICAVTLEQPEIPAGVDLAVIAVRADLVPEILTKCGEQKITTAIIISAGFKEAGEKGKALENQVAEIAKKYNIALLGPNCLGTIDTSADLNATFAATKPLPGKIAFLSQSGALGTALLDLSIAAGVGFSKFISLGNEAGLTELEFLDYLGRDEATQAILIYLEKLSKGPEFMRLAAEITKRKPVVVLRAGRSEGGAKAAMSHTGSLAPADAVFAAACRQSGIILADSIREFFNLAKLFQLEIRTPLQRLVILTNGGGPSVVTADLIGLSKSLSLAELSEETKSALRQVLPPMAAVGNPVDIIGDALSDRYRAALKILVAEPNCDAIILLLTPQLMTEVEATAKLLLEFRAAKTIIPAFLGGPTVAAGLEFLKQSGLPNFDFPDDAVEALEALAQGPRSPASRPPEAGLLNSKMLDFATTTKLLADYQINLSGRLAKTKEELPQIFAELNCPALAIKAISPDIIHKTDTGAVKLNLGSAAELAAAWDEIVAQNSTAKIEGMLIQPMEKGKEVIIGMKRDPIFGPTILFGLGGIFTEALKDTSLRVAPVSKEMALEMMQEIRGAKLLTGLRGESAVSFDALADLVVKISKLSVDHPEIKEVDLNPVMATPKEAMVVDARVMA